MMATTATAVTAIFYVKVIIQQSSFDIIVNDDQQDATVLAYLFIPNQLYMSRAMSSPIIRST